jgi:hypothetical protein
LDVTIDAHKFGSADNVENQWGQTLKSLPGFALSDILIPFSDGSERYHFDPMTNICAP